MNKRTYEEEIDQSLYNDYGGLLNKRRSSGSQIDSIATFLQKLSPRMDSKYSCKMCKIDFDTLSELVRHNRFRHRSYTCRRCLTTVKVKVANKHLWHFDNYKCPKCKRIVISR